MIAKPKSISKEVAAQPPLVDGMRLDAVEFNRRYSLLPDLKKAELIDGVVHMPSSVTVVHAIGHAALAGWACLFSVYTPGVLGFDGVSDRLDSLNEFQPDVQLLISGDGSDPLVDGSGDDILYGPTELVAEVSIGNRERDWEKKFEIYERAGFSEYIIWQVDERVVEWFRLEGNRYRRLEPDDDGIHRSVIFPGLWLDSRSLFKGSTAEVFEVLNRGLASPEHAAFVESLKSRKTE